MSEKEDEELMSNLTLNSSSEEEDKSERDEIAKSLLLELLKGRIGKSEFFSKWAEPGGGSFQSQYSTVYSTIYSKLVELGDEAAEEWKGSEEKHNAFELLGKCCIMTFLGMELGKSKEKIGECLAQLEEKMEAYIGRDKYISADYLPGFIYMVGALRLHWILYGGGDEVGLEELRKAEAEELDFDALSPKGKAVVYFVQHTFLGEVSRTGLLDWIPSITDLFLHYVLKYKRREAGFRNVPPCGEETGEILKTAKLAPSNPTVIVAKCNCLAEKISGVKGKGDIDFGGQYFESADQAVEYLKTECKAALVFDPTSVKVNITIGEIFCVVLPPWLRDLRLAKQCIERALLFHPNSSKANTRMGIYLLTEENNPAEAQTYFEHALEADPRNFPALMQLVQTCMANHVKNKEIILEIFERELQVTEGSVSDERRATFLFQKGIFHLMLDDFSSALNSWVEAFQQCKDGVKAGFEKLPYHKRRYGWNQSKGLDHFTILSQLLLAQPGESDVTAKVRKELIQLVMSALAEENKRNNQSRGGGRGRGRGSGRYHGRGSGGAGRGFRGSGGAGGGFRGSWQDGFFDGNSDGFFAGSNNRSRNAGGGDGFGRGGFHDFGGGEKSSGSDTKKHTPKGQSPYETLGLQSTANIDDVRKAYYKLCLKHHPDKNFHLVGAEKEANLERMKSINIAYEILT